MRGSSSSASSCFGETSPPPVDLIQALLRLGPRTPRPQRSRAPPIAGDGAPRFVLPWTARNQRRKLPARMRFPCGSPQGEQASSLAAASVAMAAGPQRPCYWPRPNSLGRLSTKILPAAGKRRCENDGRLELRAATAAASGSNVAATHARDSRREFQPLAGLWGSLVPHVDVGVVACQSGSPAGRSIYQLRARVNSPRFVLRAHSSFFIFSGLLQPDLAVERTDSARALDGLNEQGFLGLRGIASDFADRRHRRRPRRCSITRCC